MMYRCIVKQRNREGGRACTIREDRQKDKEPVRGEEESSLCVPENRRRGEETLCAWERMR